MNTDTTIRVGTASRGYDVVIGAGASDLLGGSMTAAGIQPGRCLVAVDHGLDETRLGPLMQSLGAAGFTPTSVRLAASERAKSLDSVRGLYAAMLAAGLDRSSAVVSVGGGIVSDTAGFAASTYQRGVTWVVVPTTLLAMVDASIGGKTGVNIELPTGGGSVGGLGKNLIGSFWPPALVVTDPDWLATLDDRDLRCGLAECIKAAIIADPSLLDFIRTHASEILARENQPTATLIRRCVAIKADVVTRDEREADCRALLNLGHTFAHAIESIEGLDHRHGEAVSIGLVAVTGYARRRGVIDERTAGEILSVIEDVGLPVSLPATVAVDRLMDAMRYDKKNLAGRTRLVVPHGLGNVEVHDDVDEADLRSAWAAVQR